MSVPHIDSYRTQVVRRGLQARGPDAPAAGGQRMVLSADGQTKYFSLYVDLREVRFDEKRVFLTKCEAALLVAIMEAGPAYVARTELMRSIWGEVTDHTYARLAVHLSKVGKKLRECTGIQRLIICRQGRVRFDYTALDDPAIITRCSLVSPAC